MRVPLRRQPTGLERLLGRRRVRLLRRRLGLVALGAGVSLLKPRTRLSPVAVIVSALVVCGLAVAVR